MWAAGVCVLLLCHTLQLVSAGAPHSPRNSAKQLYMQIGDRHSPDLDVYTKLTDKQKNSWAFNDKKTINETLDSFLNVPADITVVVKLLGFDAEGTNQVRVTEDDLLRYLRALHLDLNSVALQPQLKHLVVKPKISFRVIKGQYQLYMKIVGALRHAAADQGRRADPGAPRLIPHTVVDENIKIDFAQKGALQGYFTLYIINPPALEAPHLYTYQKDGEGCAGSLFASREAYAWVDLAAGPVEYGPLRGRQGQVFSHSLPHPMQYKAATAGAALLPDLAALVGSAIQHLVWPPLHHAALQHYKGVEVRIVHIHDTLGPPPRSIQPDVLLQALASALTGVTEVTVKESTVSFSRCELCVAAYTGSLRVRTQRESGPEVITARSRPYLDRMVLHKHMAEYSDAILAYAGVNAESLPPGVHLLPVFIFEVANKEEPLLLDNELQAAPITDMVIGVSSRGGTVRSGFSCGKNPITTDATDITRPVLAAILQLGWGVAHTSAYYHPASGENVNHLWMVGSTPFGPLSSSMELSHVQIAAPARNVALVLLDEQLQRAALLLQALNKVARRGRFEDAVDKVLLHSMRQRLNILQYKAALVVRHLVAAEPVKALRFARSMVHDTKALDRLGQRVGGEISSRLQCGGNTGWLELMWPPVASAAACVVAVWWRRRGLTSKRDNRYERMY